jgi:lipopolysaccharide/colanic/teichoic acid biosynthesis glycosyltransferase
MEGFVQKNGRLTKGGSLPLSLGARKIGRFFLGYFSRRNGSNGTKGNHDLNKGAIPGFFENSQCQTADMAGCQPEAGSSRNGTTPIDNQCPPVLRELMVDLVSSEGAVNSDAYFGHNGHGPSRPTGNGAMNASLSARHDEQTAGLSSELLDVPFVRIPRWKRILDLTCIYLTLPCWLPLMVLVMVWIKIASPGPIFYRQERVGYRRHRFMIFKFRTMHVNADTRTHAEYFAHLMRADCPMTKLDIGGDPRLIACGRFLRASGLDELPQIFNVILGDMSLVGPRPCLPHEFENYETWQQGRVNAPPGVTGYWQVNGKNSTTFSEMIAMDMFYTRNMSLRFDLAIMLKTVPALVMQTLESRAASRELSCPANYSSDASMKRSV